MSDPRAIGAVAIAGALILVGRAVLVRQRAGEPIARYAMIWAAVFALAFGGAALLAR